MEAALLCDYGIDVGMDEGRCWKTQFLLILFICEFPSSVLGALQKLKKPSFLWEQ